MRSVAQAVNLGTTAMGAFIIIPLVYLVNANVNDEWVPTNVDVGHLDWYFFLLAGLMSLNQVSPKAFCFAFLHFISYACAFVLAMHTCQLIYW